jgi:hypothetical protein
MSTPGRKKIKRKEIATPENSNNKRARTIEEPEANQTPRETLDVTEGNNIKYNNLFLFKNIV